MSCPASADLPRPRAAVTTATPAAWSVAPVRVAVVLAVVRRRGVPVSTGSKMRQRERLVLRQRIASLFAVSTRLRCWTKWASQ